MHLVEVASHVLQLDEHDTQELSSRNRPDSQEVQWLGESLQVLQEAKHAKQVSSYLYIPYLHDVHLVAELSHVLHSLEHGKQRVPDK